MRKNAVLLSTNAYIALMDLHQIRYFLALARELHFWNTAAHMNITQSALSRHIQSMERELDVQLFERNKRNVKLTPAGRFLKEKWETELNKLDSIHQFARQIHLGESGKVRIAHPDSISGSIMPDFMARIVQVLPKLQIELVQILYENQLEFLKNYKIDLIITRDNNLDKDIRSEKIHTDYLSLVVPEQHPFKSQLDLTKENLALQKFILPVKDEGSSYNDIIRQFFKSLDLIPEVFLHSEFGSTIMAMVKKELGIAILPDSYMFHQSPGVRFIRLPYQTDLYVNWRANDHNPTISNVLKLILS